MMKRKLSLSNLLMGTFLMFNLVIRFCTIFYYPPYNGYIAAFFGGLVCCCIFVILFPKYLKAFLFIFGFSFFLFGFGAIDIQSRVFELIVTIVATTLFVINWRAGKGSGQWSVVSGQKGEDSKQWAAEGRERTPRLNRPLVILILCYVTLSLFSLLLLPVRQIVKDLWFFGFLDAFFYLFIGPLYGIYLPVTEVIQLALFVVLILQLSSTINCRENFKFLFSGIFSGAVFCALIGLLDFYGIISLAWYRFGTTASPGVLQARSRRTSSMPSKTGLPPPCTYCWWVTQLISRATSQPNTAV